MSKTGCKISFRKKDPKHKLNTSNTEGEGDNLREKKANKLQNGEEKNREERKTHETQKSTSNTQNTSNTLDT